MSILPARWRAGASVCLLLSLLSGLRAEAAQRVRICVDQADWPPYMYLQDGEVKGQHADLIRAAMSAVELQAEFRPMPWIRCQLQAERGDVDAIGPLMFTLTRDALFHFPKQGDQADPQRALGQSLDVVVTLRSSGFEYNGDPHQLPMPVRVPRSWEIAPYLREQGVEVDDGAPSERAALTKLLREGSGSVVANLLSAKILLEEVDPQGLLQISEVAVRPVPYFLAFSKRGRFTGQTQERIWQAIFEQRRLKPAGAQTANSKTQLGAEEPLPGGAGVQ